MLFMTGKLKIEGDLMFAAPDDDPLPIPKSASTDEPRRPPREHDRPTTAPTPTQAVEQLGIEVSDSPFSLELSEDQRDIRDWVHGFAEKRRSAPPPQEWDEREETPWPIIQEAAKIGLYGFEALAQFWADPSGLTLPIVNEELFWGDAGIGMSIFGTTLAVAGIYSAPARPSR